MYEHILVALDGSDLAERVLPYVTALAEKFGAKVTLTRAAWAAEKVDEGNISPEGESTSYTDGNDLAAARAYLSATASDLLRKGIAVEYGEAQGVAQDVIVDQARRRGADLIAMTTHGRSGVARMFYGSVAEEVLRRAPCPVLLVRVDE